MAYVKQNFQSGDVLFASQLNAMDEQIAANQEAIENINLAGGGEGGSDGAGTSISDIEKIEYVGKDGTADLYVVVLTDGSEHFLTVNNPPTTDGGEGTGGTDGSGSSADIPTELPCPGVLTLKTSSGDVEYDGSSDVEVSVPTPGSISFTGAVSKTYSGTDSITVNIPVATEWYFGSVVPNSTTGIMSTSGISNARLDDIYFCYSNSRIYKCTTPGNPSIATWEYVCLFKGTTGDAGADGVGIANIERTSGNGAAGTTDVYTITMTDESTYTFNVYNGKDGTDGSGSSADIPTELPCPGVLTLKTSSGDVEFDGSSNVEVSVPTPGSISFTGAVSKTYSGTDSITVNIPVATEWYFGSVVPNSTTGIMSTSGISYARLDDIYFCYSNSRIYKCTTPGSPSSAVWEYVCQFKGTTGDTGAAGADGYTPVRGVDYWTADDIATIKSYVDDAILGGSW